MATKIQLRRDTASDWTSTNPTMAAGEFGWESDTNKFKIGDGSTAWTSLGYASEGDTAGITFVGDDSTGTTVNQNETVKIAGATGITTAVSGDTLTVTGPDLSSYITASSSDTLTNKAGNISQWTNDSGYTTNTGTVTATSTDTFTNKTIDANGTGNSITNIDIDNMTAAVIVTAAETIGSNDNDTTIPTSAAVKAYADSVGGGGASLGDLSAVGSTLQSPSNAAITLDPSGTGTIELNADTNVTGDLTTSAISITDNVISTNRSNDSLFIGSNGTGGVELSTDGGQLASSGTYTKFMGGRDRVKGVVLSMESSTDIDALSGREYGHVLHQGATVTNGSSTNNNWAPRAVIFSSHTDMAGESYTKVSTGRGPTGLFTAGTINNSSGSAASTLYNLRGSQVSAGIADGTSPSQDITINRCVATESGVMMETNGTSTNTITDAYNFYSAGYLDSGAGNTNSITNLYGFYHGSSHGTNNYAFYDATNSLSVFGDVQTQAISITDNLISTNRSNDTLQLSANGTGKVVISANEGNHASRLSSTRYTNSNNLYYQDLSETLATGTQRYMNSMVGEVTLTASQSTSTNSNDRWRNQNLVRLDMNGNSSTSSSSAYRSRGPLALSNYTTVVNNGGSSSTLGNAGASLNGLYSYLNNQDVTITAATGVNAMLEFESDGTGNLNVTEWRGFQSYADAYGSSGSLNVTNFYHYYCDTPGGTITNAYAFYSADATASSRMGAIRLDNQSGDPTHGADFSWIFAKDESASSEVFVKDEAGNVTKISPHNEAGEWEYYSRNTKTGKTVRVNMEAMIRDIEGLTGNTYIESE